MKRIINWIKNTRAYRKLKDRAVYTKRLCIKNITMRAFKIIIWSKDHAQENYDRNIIELYKGVRRRNAFVFKTKIISPGKGINHYKILLIETPENEIKVEIMRRDHPEFFKFDYVNKKN